MDAPKDDHTALAYGPQRGRDQRPNRGKDDGGVQFLGWRIGGTSGPFSSQPPGERLPLVVTFAGEGEDPASLMGGDLRDYVGRGPEAVEAEAFGVAGHAEGAVADQTRAQEQRRLEIRLTVRDREAKAFVSDGALRVAAVYVIAGKPGIVT